MSLGEADAKFPTAHESPSIGPEPTVENPAGVYPKSDPSPRPIPSRTPGSAEQFTGNPFVLRTALRDVDHAFGKVIAVLESEESTQVSENSNTLLERFRTWRDELDELRGSSPEHSKERGSRSRSRGPVQAGGIFAD